MCPAEKPPQNGMEDNFAYTPGIAEIGLTWDTAPMTTGHLACYSMDVEHKQVFWR
jgi:hypothetical protein